MRRRAKRGDGDFLALNGFRRIDLGAHENSVNAFVVLRRDHHDIGAFEHRSDHRSTACGRELNIAGEKRIDTARRAAADENRFGFDAMLLEETALLGDPNRAIGRAERAHADTNLVETPGGRRASAGDRRHQKEPSNRLSHNFHRSISDCRN